MSGNLNSGVSSVWEDGDEVGGNGRCAVAAKNVLLSLIARPVHSVSCARAHNWASLARTHLHCLVLLYSYTRQQQRCTSADSDGDRSPRHWKLSWEITCDRAFFKASIPALPWIWPASVSGSGHNRFYQRIFFWNFIFSEEDIVPGLKFI